MEKALVVGASGGIGAAVSAALSERGARVVALSRSLDGLNIAEPGAVANAMERLEGPFDTVFIATGILMPEGGAPEKSIGAFDAGAFLETVAVNAAGPMLVLRHLLPRLPRDRAVKIGVLSARVGSIDDNRIGGWHSYRASKAALNMLMRGAAVELSRTHGKAVLLCLHPGTVETAFTSDYPGHRKVAPARAASELLSVLDGAEPRMPGGFYDRAGKRIPW